MIRGPSLLSRDLSLGPARTVPKRLPIAIRLRGSTVVYLQHSTQNSTSQPAQRLLCMPLAPNPPAYYTRYLLPPMPLALHTACPSFMLLAFYAYCLFSIPLTSHPYRPLHTLPALHTVYFSYILPASHASACSYILLALTCCLLPICCRND